jgi:hypothetical protein
MLDNDMTVSDYEHVRTGALLKADYKRRLFGAPSCCPFPGFTADRSNDSPLVLRGYSESWASVKVCILEACSRRLDKVDLRNEIVSSDPGNLGRGRQQRLCLIHSKESAWWTGLVMEQSMVPHAPLPPAHARHELFKAY